jgi:hypothetical protein
MKVSELIEKLQKAPPDAEVNTEGCDCNGDVAAVLWSEGDGVMLARSDAHYSRSPESWGVAL